MFFFSHQTDRLNSFILTDFSCSLSNVEKNNFHNFCRWQVIFFPHLPFRLFSNLFSVTMLALLLRISSKIAQKCRYKIVEFILSTLLKRGKTYCLVPFYLIGYQNDAKCRSIDLLAAYAVVQPASAFGLSIKHRGMALQTKIGHTINVRPQVYSVFIVTVYS